MIVRYFTSRITLFSLFFWLFIGFFGKLLFLYSFSEMTPQDIQTRIAETLDATMINVESADNIHFYVTVVSSSFADMSKIKQHRLVKDLFAAQFADESIHAMSLKTFTPEKWAEKQANALQ